MLPDCAIFAADALLLATCFPKIVLGENSRPSHLSVWGAVIKKSAVYEDSEAVETLARQIEEGMHGKEWRHSAIYERDLERLWPLKEKDREAKIAQFATQYGFRLRFYSKGNVAIFDKPLPQ